MRSFRCGPPVFGEARRPLECRETTRRFTTGLPHPNSSRHAGPKPAADVKQRSDYVLHFDWRRYSGGSRNGGLHPARIATGTGATLAASWPRPSAATPSRSRSAPLSVALAASSSTALSQPVQPGVCQARNQFFGQPIYVTPRASTSPTTPAIRCSSTASRARLRPFADGDRFRKGPGLFLCSRQALTEPAPARLDRRLAPGEA